MGIVLSAWSCGGDPKGRAEPPSDDTGDIGDTGADPLADADGDGYLAVYDCDDSDPTVHPGAEDECHDDIDQDCDGEAMRCEFPDVGMEFEAESDYGFLGMQAEFADDIDGDGLPEVVLDAGCTETDSREYGGIYFIFSTSLKESVPGSTFAVEEADVILRGATATTEGYLGYYGAWLGQPGDIDGRGVQDYLVGLSEFGLTYVLFGEDLTFSGEYDIEDATAALVGPEDSCAGYFAAAAEASGGGSTGIVVGAPCYGPGLSGRVYLFDSAAVEERRMDLETESTALVTGSGAHEALSVGGIVTADYDLDGIDDIVVGAGHDGFGAVYVFDGSALRAGGAWQANDADVVLLGNAYLEFAEVPFDASDVDGDGAPDLAVLARWADSEDPRVVIAGEAYLWWGGALLGRGTATESEADVTIRGARDYDNVGRSGGSCGDMDRDGLADILVSSIEQADEIARSNLFYGDSIPAAGTLSIDDADVVFEMADSSAFDGPAAGGQDVTGDGLGDILVGHPSYRSSKYGGPGRAFLLFGW